MDQIPQSEASPDEPAAGAAEAAETVEAHSRYKTCAHCKRVRPLSEFLRRTGRRSGKGSRRGACRACRQQKRSGRTQPPEAGPAAAGRQSGPGPADGQIAAAPRPPVRPLARRPLPAPPPVPKGLDVSVLRPTRSGHIWMRGKTDKGRRWQQETDLELAITLVKEHAAIVVNRHTIRRLYSNKKFRRYILTRDRYTCFYCGGYGDTIDHLLPRAKGGHTTPVNCVCACSLCNQSKADRSVDEFMSDNATRG
ncbi:HNH endonuclease [Paenibacillus ginsengihumi]|uniref:HNH endonuclease n=1 Tax=Paenibacillus ginsengihumi TaxID=431596 RepID=UPI0003AA0356|nr:HNH endonuclease [Paenibacillus ginsengihumi]